MEKEYLKVTPYELAKRLGFNVLECHRSAVVVTKRDEDDMFLFTTDFEITDFEVTEEGLLRIKRVKI